MIPIPYASEVKATVGGRVAKTVHCPSCDREYLYWLSRQAEGAGTSFLFLDNAGAERRAQERAVRNLERALLRGQEFIPCPNCRRYPDIMLPDMRRGYARGLRIAGWLTLPFVLLSWFITICSEAPDRLIFAEFAVGISAVMAAFFVGRALLARAYNPNSPRRTRAREQLAAERAMTRERFDAVVAQME